MAKAITPKDFEKDLKKALRDVAKSARSRLLTPTSSWSNKPEFTIQELEQGGDLIERIVTDSDEYFFLDEGTSVRYATMTRDFVAKTKPRSFASGGGQGSLAYVNRGMPRPGIQARKWTEMTELEYGPVLQAAIDRAIAGSSSQLFALTKRRHGVVDE